MKKQDDSQSASKLFIGGLTQTTTKDQLEQAFTKYGQIVDSIVMKNQQTGQSRGFGFVTFKDASSAQKALQQQTKIDNKLVDVKYCNPRTQSAHAGHPQQQQQHPYQQQTAISTAYATTASTDDRLLQSVYWWTTVWRTRRRNQTVFHTLWTCKLFYGCIMDDFVFFWVFYLLVVLLFASRSKISK
jgi:hypothetical protein